MKTLYPNKRTQSTSFNLTATGRELLKNGAKDLKSSQSDYLEFLIRSAEFNPLIIDPFSVKRTGKKGGAKSYFYGKNRGTTTALAITDAAFDELESQLRDVNQIYGKMSRGDYIEFLLRRG